MCSLGIGVLKSSLGCSSVQLGLRSTDLEAHPTPSLHGSLSPCSNAARPHQTLYALDTIISLTVVFCPSTLSSPPPCALPSGHREEGVHRAGCK